MRRALAAIALAAMTVAAPASSVLAAEKAADAPRPSAFDYKPQDKDERGLWMRMEEEERELKTSPFLIRDPDLNGYVRGVLCRAVTEAACGSVRVYLIRSPYFNATMAPNGMMHIYSGLLLRVRSEAELAAVLSHEFAHFENQHSLQSFRDIRGKTDAMAWLSFVPYVGLIGQLTVAGSIFGFNREMEKQADLASIGFLASSGYAPDAAASIWTQLRAEQDATAAVRKIKSRKDKNGGFFATHPSSADRLTYLSAEAKGKGVAEPMRGAAEYRAALAKWWPQFIDDQIKLNDFGGTDFLLTQMADGRTGTGAPASAAPGSGDMVSSNGVSGDVLYARAELLRSRGNPADFAAAAALYRQAIGTTAAGAPLPENWRGLGLAMIRSGSADEGRAALKTYLAARPDASDKAMIAMMAGE